MSSSHDRPWPVHAAALAVACILAPASAFAQSTTKSALPSIEVEQGISSKAGKKASKAKAPAPAPLETENSAAGNEEANHAGHEALPNEPSNVGTKGLAVPLNTTQISTSDVTQRLSQTSDTASLLEASPGVSIFRAGGVSGLPTINGMNDDRVKVLLNGMVVTSACSNHMNPPLSYTDPAQVGSIEILSGVSPVSKGGDSLGGTVIVEGLPPHFAAAGSVHTAGSISSFYRSNGDAMGTSLTAHAATNKVSFNYSGAWTQANNYEDGNGREVKSTQYEAQNHLAKLAFRDGNDLYTVEVGGQYIPRQGFANQPMDMVENKGIFVNTRYLGTYDWGKIDARAFFQHTLHEMNKLEDKSGNMPMNTDGKDAGYSVKAEIPLSSQDVIRIGNEFHHQSLEDWWPPVLGMGGMCCNDYHTIHNGTRDRVGTFAEWERKWTPAWSTQFGLRNDTVWMDTGNVSGYNINPAMYLNDANAFNARSHDKTDVNFDGTALARFTPNTLLSLEAGYARKTRSPNLYERYTWSKSNNNPSKMAMRMIGWFGDLNGYAGDIDLDPEVAHTLSTTAVLGNIAKSGYELKITPYYTFVEDYIGVRSLGITDANGARYLQFANHDAELYGINVSGTLPLIAASALGRFDLLATAAYVHGENADTGVSLYHMMPFHGTITVAHTLGNWSNAIELSAVGGKHNVDTVRNELKTDGYALVNLRTSYEWESVRFDLGIKNVFDEYYEDPLAGHSLELGRKDNVAGEGRSFTAGATVKF